MTRVDPSLMNEIRKYSSSSFNIEACFNCGNCTAICPISDEKEQFPRSLIRYAQLGLKDRLLSSTSMWSCAYCGDCSETCPRDADPGELVMALRRWAMSEYDVTGISKLIYKKKWGGILYMSMIAILAFALIFLFGDPTKIPQDRPIRLFDLLPFIVVELGGIFLAIILIGIIGLSILNQYRLLSKSTGTSFKDGFMTALNTHKSDGQNNSLFYLIFSPLILIKNAFKVIFVDILGHRKLLQCELEKEKTDRNLLTSRFIMHAFILFGFAGLGIATIANMLFKHDANAMVDIFSPIRFLGIVSGMLLMIGTLIPLSKRLLKNGHYYKHSMATDYFLLFNLFMIGLSGFLITGTFYVQVDPIWGYIFFVLHLVFVMELLFLAPFGKFAHVWYRSFALWLHYSLQNREKNLAKKATVTSN